MGQTDRELMPEDNDPKEAIGYKKPTHHERGGRIVHPGVESELVKMTQGEAAKKSLEAELGIRPDELARIRAAREKKDQEKSSS